MGLFDNLKDRFNKAEFTVAPQKKLKTISKEFLEAFDLQLVATYHPAREGKAYVDSLIDALNKYLSKNK